MCKITTIDIQPCRQNVCLLVNKHCTIKCSANSHITRSSQRVSVLQRRLDSSEGAISFATFMKRRRGPQTGRAAPNSEHEHGIDESDGCGNNSAKEGIVLDTDELIHIPKARRRLQQQYVQLSDVSIFLASNPSSLHRRTCYGAVTALSIYRPCWLLLNSAYKMKR